MGVADPIALAGGHHQITVNNMCGGVRTLSIERGHDPREFTRHSSRRRGCNARHPDRARTRHRIGTSAGHPGTGSAFGLLCY